MRLARGAKETFGWVIVAPERELMIPQEAWERYDFHAGDQAIFITGSRKSGGFGLTNRKLLAEPSFPLGMNRILGYAWFNSSRVVRIPVEIPVNPGDRLLTVFGSGYALGFITRGPIYEAAKGHPELGEFNKE